MRNGAPTRGSRPRDCVGLWDAGEAKEAGVVTRCVAVAALGVAIAFGAAPGLGQTERPRMPANEAIAAFAEFLHIDPAGIEVVRESEPDQEHEPDTAFAGVVRHTAPTDSPWWGPRNAEGMVTCRLKVGRLREDGRPYVQGARWQANRMPGDIVVDEAQAETIAREFLRTYCPFYDEGLQPVPPEVLRRTSRPYWSSFWHRETDTTSLRMNVGMRLDDGSIVYNCWYRTGLTPAAITEEQARQIADEQWRARYPEQELVFEEAAKLIESEFSQTRGPAWMLTYRHGPVRPPMDLIGTQYAWLTVDAVTGAITKAPNFTSPKLTQQEAQRICDEQWLTKWPDETLEFAKAWAGLDRPESPSHGPVWLLSFKRTTEGALPVDDGVPYLVVQIDGLTGEVLRAPNLTKPKLSEADAEQVYQAEWVTKWPGDTLAPPTIHGFLDSPKSPTHGPVWVFAYQHNREGVHSYDVEVVMDALTGAILEGPDFSEGRPRQVKQ